MHPWLIERVISTGDDERIAGRETKRSLENSWGILDVIQATV